MYLQLKFRKYADMRELRDGDIVNLDVSVFYNGYHGMDREYATVKIVIVIDINISIL
jgi:hypothetical protein